ncbi:MAG TPA: sialidase family protein, partial [Thermoanaerobaculia bacterium]|nr:sialidase family protein [Thermoanaerobaculia bacterium]
MRILVPTTLLLLALAPPLRSADSPAPAWPSYALQLEKDGIPPDSALARLIAANQDFSLLRADEATDHIRIPLWLRVSWRKAHPEQKYSAADPTGGYPLVLKEAYEWMLSHPDLAPADAPPSLPPGRSATVGADHRISGLQTAPRSESDIRINFRDPSRIISASNDIEASGHQSVYYSSDGGATWGQTSLPFITGDAFHSDPTVDWTSDGTAWSTTIGINASASVLHMRAYKSTDGGATWTFDATFSGTQSSTDKQMIWVDHSDTSAFKDNLYAIWHNGNPVYMNRRTGPAGAWQTPILVSGSETTGTGIGGDVKTNSDGEVFGFWPDTGSQRIFVVKSTNGGVSYGTPIQIASTFDSFDIGVPSFNSRRALIYVSAGTQKTATKNLVYASWTDLSGASGCTGSGNEPGSNVASTCKTRVWFSRSTDGGAHWSAAVMLNNQSSLNDQYNQWLTVDPTNGVVGIMYYDTVGDPGRKKSDVYYQSSFDDGVTWSSPIKVTTGETDETISGADNGNQYGDYNGMSAYATKFFPSWTDRRNNAREEIWTAEIDDVPCSFTGAPTLGSVTTPANNQVQVTWTNGTPASAHFNVYRAVGTCASPGTFQQVGSAVSGTSFLDTTVSGSVAYAYRVTGLDVTGACESTPSGCTEVVATGACTAAPTFGGLTAVANVGTATCGLNLTWSAGAPVCAGPLTYNIYRSTVPGFTPGPASLLASGVTGTAYSDTSLLNSSAVYYYVVRAVDSSNGTEEGNTVQRSATPTGPAAVGTLTCTPGPGPGLAFYTVTPCRLVDTRNPAGPQGGPALAAGAQRTFNLAGICAVPATARALSINVTVVGAGAAGDLRLFPADQPTPLISAINFRAGQTRTNNSALALAWSLGTATLQNDAAAPVHVILDVNGYYQ